MANNTVLATPPGATPADPIITVDLGPFVDYPTAGAKLPTSAIYVGTDDLHAPTVVTYAHPFPVAVANFPAAFGVTGAVDISDKAARILGHVAVDTLPALPNGGNTIGNVGVVTQPPRSRLTDTIAAAVAGDVVMIGTLAIVPQFAPIAASANGDNTIVIGVTGKQIRVLQYVMKGRAAVDATWKSGAAGGSNLSGAFPISAAGDGAGGSFCPVGLIQTAVGQPLVLNLGAAIAVAGHLAYMLV